LVVFDVFGLEVEVVVELLCVFGFEVWFSLFWCNMLVCMGIEFCKLVIVEIKVVVVDMIVVFELWLVDVVG